MDPQPSRGIVVGLGRQGLKHVDSLLFHPSATIVGAADVTEGARERFLSGYEGYLDVPVCEDLETLLGEVDTPDFAIIALPHDQHMAAMRTLAEERIPTIKEKPFARNLAETEELLAIPGIEKYCFPAAQRRYGHVDTVMRQMLKRAPPPVDFRYVYMLQQDRVDEESWRSDLARAGGGSLLDMGYHVLTRINDWFGPPDYVQVQTAASKTRSKESDIDDVVYMSMYYNSGLHGWVMLSPVSDKKEEDFRVQFPGVFIAGPKDDIRLWTEDGNPIAKIDQPPEDLELAQLSHFLRCIRSGEDFAGEQRFHLEVMKIIEQCYLAASTKKAEGRLADKS